jgi:nucleoside phosphorylase
MILIVAALGEELGTAMGFFAGRRRVRRDGLSFWAANSREGMDLYFLKTGMGPGRSFDKLTRALEIVTPSRILAIGYAGALEPSLSHGDIVIVRRAIALDDEKGGVPLAEVRVQGAWEMASIDYLIGLSELAGVHTAVGESVTSWHIIGSPEQKQTLCSRFRASIVDMETAALAAAAGAKNVAFDCVRAITDDAGDDLLAPFSSDPGSGMAARAVRIAGAGRFLARYSLWRERSALARTSLRRFLRLYFDDLNRQPGS